MHASAQEFAQLLGPLRRAVLRATRLTAQLPDLSEPQIEVLRSLATGQLAPSDLARRLHLAPSTLSNLLRVMADAGLVERSRQPHDARRVDVAISARARGLLDAYDAASLSAIEDFLRGLTEHERRTFEHVVPVLRRMCAAFTVAATASGDSTP